MNFIYPVSEVAIKPYIGYTVCAVLHDGDYFIGKLTDIRNGQIILDGQLERGQISSKPNKEKAQTSGLGLGLGMFGLQRGLFLGGLGLTGGLLAGGFGLGLGMLSVFSVFRPGFYF